MIYSSRFINYLKTGMNVLVLFGLIVGILTPQYVQAISEEQRQLIRSGIYYYDLEESDFGSCYGPVQLVGSDNIEQGYNYFIDRGLEPIYAAALIGNFILESQMKPDAFNSAGGGQGAYGIAQWRSGRQAALREKPNYETLGAQLEFVWEELQGGENAAYEQIIQTSNVEDAAVAVDQYYERSEQDHHAERIEYSQAVLTEYGSGSAASSGGFSGSQGGCAAGLPDGESPELAEALLESSNVSSDYEDQLQNIAAGLGPCPSVNNGNYTVDAELLRVLVALAENNTYTISSLHRGCTSDTSGSGSQSRHWRGKAVDLSGSRPINGDTMEGSFGSHSENIQQLVNQAKELLKDNCELGVPNNQYISGASQVESECTNVFLDTPETTGATGPHIHIGVP
jgi:hypothetical protein